MPVAPIAGRTEAEMVCLAATMITAALAPELLPSASWFVRR